MRVLITGGTGSLGHALVAHFLATADWRLIVYSRDELKQAHMRARFPDPRLDFFLGDVRDLPRLHLAFDASVDIVIHAAALKRIDSVHADPDEVFKTNVLGSRNVLHAARGKVSRVLLISTDKACYPTNAYGLSKAMAEHLFTTFNVYSAPKGTVSSVVRYGNVLDSRGSVLHVWREQVARAVPLTITHPTMTRFLLTLPQAAQLITATLDTMEGGETVIPRLPAARVVDLAHALAPDHPTVEIGLRPGGEKCHETLMTAEEHVRASGYIPSGRLSMGIFVVPPSLAPWRTHSRYPVAGEPIERLDAARRQWITTHESFTSDRARQLSRPELDYLLATAR